MNRGAELLRVARGSQGAKARRLDVSQAFVSLLCRGKKVPGDALRVRLSTLYQIPREAWDEPVITEGAPSGASAPPGGASAPELPVPSTGSVIDRARALLAFLAAPGRTTQELHQAREIRAALTFEARLLGAMTTKAKLHEHPDWKAHVEQMVTALGPVPGALDVLEAFLTRAIEESRAAA